MSSGSDVGRSMSLRYSCMYRAVFDLGMSARMRTMQSRDITYFVLWRSVSQDCQASLDRGLLLRSHLEAGKLLLSRLGIYPMRPGQCSHNRRAVSWHTRRQTRSMQDIPTTL